MTHIRQMYQKKEISFQIYDIFYMKQDNVTIKDNKLTIIL